MAGLLSFPARRRSPGGSVTPVTRYLWGVAQNTPQHQEDRMTRTTRTPMENCQRIVDCIAATTGEAWTFGYIGNCGAGFDDRAWYAFRPHAGRVGTSADRIGGMATEDLDLLVSILSGALKMATMLKSTPTQF